MHERRGEWNVGYEKKQKRGKGESKRERERKNTFGIL